MNILPYGDIKNDGLVQLSFTLPLPCNRKAQEAARVLVSNLGLKNIQVVHFEDIGSECTYFVVYGKCISPIETETLKFEEEKFFSREEIEKKLKKSFEKKINIVGACTGSDTHTMGLDAILNAKGYDGHYGLERYTGFNVTNMGGQVQNSDLIIKAKELKASAILISQVVTEKDLHLHNMTELVDMLEVVNLRDDILLICGGPRLDNHVAKELGFDQGYGKGTFAEHVATFIVEELGRDYKCL
jgi:beta-lysine 5,6-aminomutase beta subunit